MSIMRLETMPGGKIDSNYISSVDLSVQNLGAEEFDFLLHMYYNGVIGYVALHHVPAYGSVWVPDIPANLTPFSMLLVTNINSYTTTGIVTYAKLNGNVVAVYSQEDFIRIP